MSDELVQTDYTLPYNHVVVANTAPQLQLYPCLGSSCTEPINTTEEERV